MKRIIFSETFLNGSSNLGQKTKHSFNFQEQWSCLLVDFVVPVDFKIKAKESEEIYKYFDLKES